MTQFRIGFLPLVDAALPIIAHEMGLAQQQGVGITLVRDPSWATVRDRLIYGQTDAAHMLAPLAIATSLGLDRPAVPMVAPFMLGLNGNGITITPAIAAQIADETGVTEAGLAFAAIARQRRDAGKKLRLAVVHRFSSHNYMLRYWLAASGCNPDRDVEIVTVPPPFVTESLLAGEIDGSCVGEPWNSVAVERGAGVIITTTSQIWSRGVEKLLAFRQSLVEERREEVEALLRALHEAGKLIEQPDRIADIASLLARSEYVDQPEELIARALSNRLVRRRDEAPQKMNDYLVVHREAANFPWRSQAMWLYSQMIRWGHAPLDEAGFAAAAQVFRPDIYRAAMVGTDAVIPAASTKVEGAIEHPIGAGSVTGRLILGPDRFFDGMIFDPDEPLEYLRRTGM
ncbi:MAG: CmpA/NrtA family ABC transporter substrate-binding protein [Sphingobium sp.]